MIKVITIEREYGSGAADIAQKVSERLGWTLWDQKLTTEIASCLECDCVHVERREECCDPLYYRLFKSFLKGSFEGSINAHKLKLADADGIRVIAEKVVRDAADEGNCVIVGRGSTYYLHERPDAFHVFVYAPFDEKVRRLQEMGKSKHEAIHLTETVDIDRAAFIKQYFGVDWPPRQYFHVMINSAMGEEAAVQIVLDGIRAYKAA